MAFGELSIHPLSLNLADKPEVIILVNFQVRIDFETSLGCIPLEYHMI